MRIAHLNNIANVAWRLARAQRRLGHEAVVFSLRDNPLQFPSDVQIPGADGPLRWNAAMFGRTRTFASFDVLHIHGGIWVSQVFYPFFKRTFPAKVIAVHHHGSETRLGKGLHHMKVADVRFHSTPDLARWLPDSTWIPNPIDIGEPAPAPENPVPVFAHFPTVPERKGTDRIIELFREGFGPLTPDQTVDLTRLRGRDAELWVGNLMPHERVLELMRRCDVLFDQLSEYGSYGVAAIEAMAYGKPVFGTANVEWYPDCPILRLDAPGVVERMREIARDDETRRELGRASRAYVARVHDSGAVARRVLRSYYEVGQRPAFSVEQTRSYWIRRGPTYAEEITDPGVLRRFDAQRAELLAAVDPLLYQSVVEVGCGYGRIGRRLAGRKRWTGVDLSRGQLLKARQEPILATSLLQASADTLPLADGTADLVVAVELLMHVPPERIHDVVRELWRVSRRYLVHLDWFEDYLVGFGTGWNWVHDYPTLWKTLGGTVKEIRIASTGIQSMFLVEKTRAQPPAERPVSTASA